MISNIDFLNALFDKTLPNTACTLHSFGGDPSKDGRWNAMPWLKGTKLPTLSPFNNNYVCVSMFYPSIENKFYRRKICFASLHCVMIDDLGTKLPMSDLKLKPSVLIETSPNNFQAWLFLEQPIFSLIDAETLIDEMIRAGISAEADPGMKGVTRVARLPVGANGKAKYHGENNEVWPQVVHEHNLSLRYTPQEIAIAYGLDLTPKRIAPPPAPPRNGVDPERAGIINWLKVLGNHIECTREGYHEIKCPWVHEHTDKTASGTYYMEPQEMNSFHGGFICHHGHCGERDINDLVGWLRAQKDMLDEENKSTQRSKPNVTKKKKRKSATTKK